MTMLQAGHRRFLSGSSPTADLSAHRRGQLLESQRPFAIVLTCADSRVAPEHVFDVGLGEIFVVRVAGNVVSEEALASIEYAIHELGTSLLVCMGHQHCGAVTAAAEDIGDPQMTTTSMRELYARLQPSVARARGEGLAGPQLVERAVELNAERALSEIRTRSKLARQLETDGRLGMVAASYELETGDLVWLPDAPAPTAAYRSAHPPHTDPHAGHAAAETAERLPIIDREEIVPEHRHTASAAGEPALPAPPGGAHVEATETAPPEKSADSAMMLMIASSVSIAGVALLMALKRHFSPS